MSKQPDKLSTDICASYHEGLGVTTIARNFNVSRSKVLGRINRWYHSIYGEPVKSFHEKRDKFADELKDRYDLIYKPFIYTRQTLSAALGCTIAELNYMMNKYNLDFDRIQSTKKQRTIGSIPLDEYLYYQKIAKSMGMSVRKFFRRAATEFCINHKGDF